MDKDEGVQYLSGQQINVCANNFNLFTATKLDWTWLDPILERLDIRQGMHNFVPLELSSIRTSFSLTFPCHNFFSLQFFFPYNAPWSEICGVSKGQTRNHHPSWGKWKIKVSRMEPRGQNGKGARTKVWMTSIAIEFFMKCTIL